MHLKLDLKVSPVFVRNWEAIVSPLINIIVNQGGSRSGKTYSILQCILIYCLNNKGKIIDVVRKTHRELRDTILVDWHEILIEAGLEGRISHNKTHHEYRINGNTIRFFGIDKAQKRKGSKRDLLYVNECNGITLDDWIQLTIRLTGKAIVDFNPSEYFWLNEHVLEKRKDVELIVSNYLDNYDFLPAKQIAEIENLINIDDYYYKVYALGILTALKGQIYNNFSYCEDEEYDVVDAEEILYGIDWGFEHAMVLVEIKYAQEKIYERCLYMESYKQPEDLIAFMEEKGISYTADIYADPAYPGSIQKLRDAGFSVRKAKKDIKDGVRFCQGLKRKICKSSETYYKQMQRYKWKQTSDGKIVVGEPVKIEDDGPDAFRYGAYTHLKRLAA